MSQTVASATVSSLLACPKGSSITLLNPNNAQQGQTLSTTNGTWGTNPTPTAYTYQWQDCDASGQNCSPVATNGTLSSYTLQASDAGHTIVATVRATDAYGDVSASSSSTRGIAPASTSPRRASAVATPSGSLLISLISSMLLAH